MVRKRTFIVLRGEQHTLTIGEMEGHSKMCRARGSSKATYHPGFTRRAVVADSMAPVSEAG
jgi:hypothetical protein